MLPIPGGKYKHSLWEWVFRALVIMNTWNHTGMTLLLLVVSTENVGSGLVPLVPAGRPHSGVPEELCHLSLGQV